MPTADQFEISDAIQTGRRSYPLPGYSRALVRDAEVVATTALVESMSDVITQYNTLYSWARNQEQPRALRGRAPVYVAALDDAGKTWCVVRHGWHGGFFAPVTGDRFLRPTRAPIELLRSFMLRECKIPTPEVLGFALYRAGPFMARVDVASRYVENAHDFGAILSDMGGNISRAAAFEAVQLLLVQLAEFGFVHPDLNVKNILLYREGRQLVAAILDVDVVKWETTRKPAEIMLANVARLARSMRKARTQFGVQLSDADLNDFVARMLSASPARSRVKETSGATFTVNDRL